MDVAPDIVVRPAQDGADVHTVLNERRVLGPGGGGSGVDPLRPPGKKLCGGNFFEGLQKGPKIAFPGNFFPHQMTKDQKT